MILTIYVVLEMLSFLLSLTYSVRLTQDLEISGNRIFWAQDKLRVIIHQCWEGLSCYERTFADSLLDFLWDEIRTWPVKHWRMSTGKHVLPSQKRTVCHLFHVAASQAVSYISFNDTSINDRCCCLFSCKQGPVCNIGVKISEFWWMHLIMACGNMVNLSFLNTMP